MATPSQHSQHMKLASLKSWRASEYEVRTDAKAQAAAAKPEPATFRQLVTLVRRLAIMTAALVYIARSLLASMATLSLLQAAPMPEVDMSYFQSPQIAPWMGNGTIRASPLLMFGLWNSTAPINETLYLDGAMISREGCMSVPVYSPALYNNAFLRTIAATLMAQTSYNLTFFRDMELIAPVVDCYWSGIWMTSVTVLRSYYLLRDKVHTDDVALVSLSWSFQDYIIPKQNKKGPASVANLGLIRDMAGVAEQYRAVALTYPYGPLQFQVYEPLGLTIDHELRLQSIPEDPVLEPPKEIVTSSRTGFYQSVETQQSNFRNTYFVPDSDPTLALSRWRFRGGPVMRDTWAWVHYVHIFFALDALLTIVILVIIIYRNLALGHLWIGDAFVSISNTLLHRGAIVLMAWIVNDGWTLMNFCYQQSGDVIGMPLLYGSTDIIRADFLTMFLSLASLVGYALRERIDPALVVLVFELAFKYRLKIAQAFPTLVNELVMYFFSDMIHGILPMEPVYAQSTPARVWTVHELDTKDPRFVALSMFPVFGLLSVIIVYALLRKIYRRFFPDKLHVVKVSDYSEKTEILQSLKRTLTQFEVATGAALQSRVGVVSDYENCIYVKGVKYASADGIYCNGYVIANGKFLVATDDLMAIFLIKLTRLRFQNVYVYEVDGTSVAHTARLLYAHTMSWSDLLHLNISMLA